jgi:hypothetical protein
VARFQLMDRYDRMMRPWGVLAILAVGLVVAPASATASASASNTPASEYRLRHPARGHCRAHYQRVTRTVRVHRHGRRLRIRRTFCVRRRSGPAAAQPAAIVSQVHLAPLAQTPNEPLRVTYSFSATASEQAGSTKKPVALPKGVVELFDGGNLVCAVNVGGAVTGGSCPVTYENFGAHTIVVTYLGPSSSTETQTEQVNPFPTSTTLALEGPYKCAANHETEPEAESCWWTASALTTDQFGHAPAEGSTAIEIKGSGGGSAVGPTVLGGQPTNAFGPVTFALVREHGKQGWRCSERLGALTLWFDSIGGRAPEEQEPQASPTIVPPQPGRWSEEKCGDSMTAQAMFGARNWASSSSSSIPMPF